MDIKKEILNIQKRTELQRIDHKIFLRLNNLKLSDFSKEFVFELLKMFIGADKECYSSLSIDKLTFVSNEKNNMDTIRYVYPWGDILIQIYICKGKEDLLLSVKFLD